MKMNSQSRSFVKQVQVDLLALCDADLSRTVRRWVEGSDSSRTWLDVPEDTRFALGYTRAFQEAFPLSDGHSDIPGAESEGSEQWHAPSPYQLRTLLSAMDVNMFARHVIALAFKSLHTTYPEWYDGVTFNAHLANYLRRMRVETANRDQGVRQKLIGKIL
ncbi:MAG TPA: hypothetical protein VKV20_15920 [Ktedonobacteraceae bacterium]|jgi:hypothetical protein|nr:hypothetical protein [Ktedonobacteraceae bacterium]